MIVDHYNHKKETIGFVMKRLKMVRMVTMSQCLYLTTIPMVRHYRGYEEAKMLRLFIFLLKKIK